MCTHTTYGDHRGGLHTAPVRGQLGEQWVEFCYSSCFASKVVSFDSTKTMKLTFFLFCKTTEASLFVSDNVKTSFVLVLVRWIRTEFYKRPYHVRKGGKSQFCVNTVVPHPKLLVSVQPKLRN
jgi:hypothetical protein